MKENGKLEKSLDQLDDRYLLEALEYKKVRPSWKAWAALAACICLLLGGGWLAWKTFFTDAGKEEIANAKMPEAQKESVQAETTMYVDAHELLAGNEGELSIEVKKQTEDQTTIEQIDELDVAGQDVIITWAYQSIGGEDVSYATVQEINRKLKEDGYHFSVRFRQIRLPEGNYMDGKTYQEYLFQSGADIAFSGFHEKGDHSVQDAIRAGKYEPLDKYLAETSYYAWLPEDLWKSTTYQGQIYFFPNELAQDGGPALYLRKSSFTQEEAESFDGDLFSLEKYFEEGKVFLDASADYDFAETFGYSDYQGVLFTSDGNALNPLEEERCVRWLRLLNEYKAQITQKAGYNWDFSLSLSFPGTGIGEGNRPEDFYVYQWKGYVIPRLNCQTGILASSKYKREAFQFLRLIRSDASYGKLLLYGKEYLDGTGESRYSFANQLIFGLDTGLTSGQQGDGLRHFSSANEKKAYYKEWILASPVLSLQNPEVCDEMNVANDYREQLVYAKDFDETLKEAKSKTRDPMQKILKELKYWDE